MKYFKKIGISFVYIILTLLILTFVTTILSYFNILSDKIVSVVKLIIPIIGLIIGGFYIGKHSNKKGFLEGIKLGVIFSLILIIFNLLILNNSFKLKYLLFYIILIISCSLGGMIGIIYKKN